MSDDPHRHELDPGTIVKGHLTFIAQCRTCGVYVLGDEARYQVWKSQWHGPPKPVPR
jgi:hypothetical protein